MKCEDINDLLAAYLDGEVTPEEKTFVEAHLPSCPQCRAELEALSATQVGLRGVLKSMAEEASSSPQAWEKVRVRLDAKDSWLDRLHRLLISRTWQVATVTATVVVIVVVAAIWQFGGVGQAPSIPAPSPTVPTPPTISAPAPRPAPPLPFGVTVVPEEPHYLPGEEVAIKLSITSTSSEPITLSPYPWEIVVTPGEDFDQVLFSQAGGTQEKEIKPGETVTVEFAWDQKDKTGKQVVPGWYNIRSREITVRQGGDRLTMFTPGTRVLIQYPQGAMEKSFDVNQSQTVNGITVTLERVELTVDSSSFYFFFIPPDYTAPPPGPGSPPPPPPTWAMARGEYTIDGITKNADTSGVRIEGDGIKLVWGGGPAKLDPVPSDAGKLIFTITKLGDWQGPWEFKVTLR
ncbi:MAG: zf-HC2 domain-containing protein [Dehalococcoidales bacterium]|nr:zf-HC2 domain-containing protein [Dehalococcoidales bacterium]